MRVGSAIIFVLCLVIGRDNHPQRRVLNSLNKVFFYSLLIFIFNSIFLQNSLRQFVYILRNSQSIICHKVYGFAFYFIFIRFELGVIGIPIFYSERVNYIFYILLFHFLKR